jgi:hypothetical protein
MSIEEPQKRREEILKTRAEHKRLSEMIVQGISHHETVRVRGADGQEYEVEARAVNDEEFIEACARAAIPMSEKIDFGSNLKLMAALAALVADDPKLAKVLKPLESLKIGTKILELSGLAGAPKST